MQNVDGLSAELLQALMPLGFRAVSYDKAAPTRAALLAKRQTWNTNRAVAMVQLPAPPASFAEFLGTFTRDVAVACGYIPILWGIGVQVIVVADGVLQWGINPADFVSKVDNQWAIVQSLFLVDPAARQYTSARTWGQFITGKFQDAIERVLAGAYGVTPPR